MVTLKPYPEYKDSGLPWLGEIPKHWQEKRAKYFFREVDERSTTGGEELLSVSHISGVTPRSQKNVTMFMAESYVGHKLCHPADLVINTMWAWMAALGVAKQDGIVSPGYAVYRPLDQSVFIPEYFDHLLRTQPYVSEYRCRSTGIRSSRLRLYPEKFLEISIACPPRQEQSQILAYLSAKDRMIRYSIRAKRRLIELLNEQKQAIIHRAVTRGLDPNVRLKPSGIDWLGDVPEHWEVKKLKWLAEFNPSKAEAAKTLTPDDRVAFLPMERVGTDGRVDVSEYKPVAEVWQGFTYFRRHDVVVAKITPCFENGKGAYLGSLPTEHGFGTTEFIVLRANQQINPQYLYLLTTLKKLRSLGVENMTGAAGQQRVPLEFLRHFVVPVPPIIEQRSILVSLSRETNELEQALDGARREIDFLREYRTRLISDVVTGKLDVRGVELPELDETEALDDIDLGIDEDVDTDEMDDGGEIDILEQERGA